MINKTTNLVLKIVVKIPQIRGAIVTLAGAPIVQNARTKIKKMLSSIDTSKGYITKTNTSSVTETRANVGASNETTTHSIQAIVPYNKNATVATMILTPATGDQFTDEPSISLQSNVEGVRLYFEKTSTTKFNIICNIKREITLLDNLIADLNWIPTVRATTSSNTIKRIYPGPLNIPLSGTSRKIKIYGSPNTPFDLSAFDIDGNSIISRPNSTAVTPYGVVNILSSTLDKAGSYVFTQKFPPLKPFLSTTVNGAITNNATVIFTSASGVVVGDQISISDSRGTRDNEVIKVTAINVDGNANKLTLSKAVTVANSKVVVFRRSTSYYLNLETTGTKDSSINDVFPTYTMTQNIGSIITFNATTSSGAIQINGGSAGVTHTTSYGDGGRGNSVINLVYTLTGKTFTQATSKPTEDDFVVASGDADVSTIVSGSGGGTSTYIIRAKVKVEYKTTDTVVNINLDNIVS
ncbi:MAG: hypothetical protein CMC70_12280 [Flavobacteriaceae bacterium]|nr:hypothetical protein [Flavobacteriaceae bacterium]